MTGRFRLTCVAPMVPDRGSYDDLDEAIVNSDAHFDVYDSEAGEWVPVQCEDYEQALARWLSRPRCHGSGELVEALRPPGVDHRDPAFEISELPCPGCPDCRPALSATGTESSP